MLPRVVVIGSTGSGKTSLLSALRFIEGVVKKTEMVQYSDAAIDTPGELLDACRFGQIIESTRKARLALFVMDSSRPSSYPPGLGSAMNVKLIRLGVITKIDKSTKEQRIKATKALKEAGIGEVVECSSRTGEGIAELKSRIEELISNFSNS